MSWEHGILLLKPDGYEIGLDKKLPLYFARYHLSVIAVHKRMMKREDVEQYIRTSFAVDRYCDYLCSGLVVAVLVAGAYAIDKLIRIKRQIRNAHGVTNNDMMNYIHSADLGNEHYIHMGFLFPELDQAKYSLYADMNVRVTPDQWKEEIRKIESNSNVSCIGMIIEVDDLVQMQQQIKKSRITPCCLYGVRFSCTDTTIDGEAFYLIGYFFCLSDIQVALAGRMKEARDIIRYIHAYGGVAVLDYMPYKICVYEILLQRLTDLGLDGVTAYDIRFSQNEVARIEYIAADILGLLLSGGTNGVIKCGTLSIDKVTFELFINKMNCNMLAAGEKGIDEIHG